MRRQLIAATAILLLSAAGVTAQTSNQTPRADDESGARAGATTTPALVGTWKSAPDQMKLTTDFEKSVWGADASSVRTVELAVRPDATATLKVTKKVIDGRGRTVDASTWIEEVQLQMGAPQNGIATRIEHETKVTSAVRLFPDDPDYRWTLDGLRVKVVSFSDGDGNAIEIRYDTPDGRGSFWETLRREGGAAARRALTR